MLSLAKRAGAALAQPGAAAARAMSTASVPIANEPDLYLLESGPSNAAETSKDELMQVSGRARGVGVGNRPRPRQAPRPRLSPADARRSTCAT